MSRDFNNNNGNISDIYNYVRTTVIDTIKVNNVTYNALVSNAITTSTTYTDSSLVNYLTSSAINTLLANYTNTTITNSNINNAIILALNNYLTNSATTTAINNAITLSLNNYLSSTATTTLIYNNIINNNLLYTSTLNLNTLLANAATSSNNYTNTLISNYQTSVLTNAAILAAQTSCNTTSTNYTNNKIITEISDRNTAITNNNALMLRTSKTYTSTQIFSNIVVLGNLNSISIGNLTNGSILPAAVSTQSTAIGCSSSANAYSASALGFQSNAAGQYSVSIGYNSLSNGNNTISIGSSAGLNQNASGQINNLFLGSNTSINSGGNFSNSCCIGYGANIYASNQIMMGTSTETVVCPGRLNLATNYSLMYTNLPVFSSSQIGYISNASKANITFINFDSFINVNSIVLSPGVYIINFTFNLSSNSIIFPSVTERMWLGFGLGSTVNDLLIINKRLNFVTSNAIFHYFAESFFFTATTSTTVYANAQIPSIDSSGSASRFYITGQNISALRIA